MTPEWLVSVISRHSAHDTAERLIAAVEKRGLTVFARIDHAAGAASAGQSLRPTEVVIFGNPKGGTPLMQDQQIIGIDLPLKVLVWEDADGKVYATYYRTHWLAEHYGLGSASKDAVEAIAGALAAVAAEATS
jgi:uncharacterized protein (DUF302 family)